MPHRAWMRFDSERVHEMGISQGIHEDAHADAWESIPFNERRELLRRTVCAPKYQQACARARWCDLPPDVAQSAMSFMDPTLVVNASNALKAREQA